ncbi:MAG: hypothetical protein EBT95_09930 [Verrucomicrobia bacterium]|nr:hypothetical protein [Verrucomicrobiota bacterium]
MPKLAIDWRPIEGDYIKGIPSQILAAKYQLKAATIRAHMTRNKIGKQREVMLQQIKEVTRTVTTEATGEAQAYLSGLKKEVQRGMDALAIQPPSSREEVDEHFTALEKVNRVATTAFGLSEGSKTQTMNIAVLQQLTPESLSVTASNVIDTETKAV